MILFLLQDYTTKFTTLRPLCTEGVSEVANQLVDIFCTFGCPLILQTNYGRNYSRELVHTITQLWPECALVHGKSKDLHEFHGSGGSENIMKLIETWMKNNETAHWSDGLRFVQWQQNNQKNVDTNKTSFSAMFYENARLGLMSTNLAPEIISGLDSEEDLEQVINTTSVVLDNPNKQMGSRSVRSESWLPPNLTCVEGSSIPNGGSSCGKAMVRSGGGGGERADEETNTNTTEHTTRALLKRLAPSEGGLKGDIPVAIPGVSMMSMLEVGKTNTPSSSLPTSDDMLARSGIHFETICSVCEFSYAGSQKCGVCKNFCHENQPCSKLVQVKPDVVDVICLLCERSSNRSQLAEMYLKQDEKAPVKRYKHSDGDLLLGGSPHVTKPAIIDTQMRVGVHANSAVTVHNSVNQHPSKLLGYKSRPRPALFKFNPGPNDQTMFQSGDEVDGY